MELIKPEASTDGRLNAYYHTCRVVEQQRAYAGCLARVNGATGDPTCDHAIERRTCPAIAMQQEEREQGKAIYFVAREQVAEFINSVKSWAAPTKAVDGAKAELSADMKAAMTGDFSAAVNKATEKQSRVTKLAVNPGESPLEAYLRIKGQR
jgi:hypothetical protein